MRRVLEHVAVPWSRRQRNVVQPVESRLDRGITGVNVAAEVGYCRRNLACYLVIGAEREVVDGIKCELHIVRARGDIRSEVRHRRRNFGCRLGQTTKLSFWSPEL